MLNLSTLFYSSWTYRYENSTFRYLFHKSILLCSEKDTVSLLLAPPRAVFIFKRLAWNSRGWNAGVVWPPQVHTCRIRFQPTDTENYCGNVLNQTTKRPDRSQMTRKNENDVFDKNLRSWRFHPSRGTIRRPVGHQNHPPQPVKIL